MLVQANDIEGVYEVSSFENSPEILDEDDFYFSLSRVKPDEEIASEISEEMAEKISSEYGIRKL